MRNPVAYACMLLLSIGTKLTGAGFSGGAATTCQRPLCGHRHLQPMRRHMRSWGQPPFQQPLMHMWASQVLPLQHLLLHLTLLIQHLLLHLALLIQRLLPHLTLNSNGKISCGGSVGNRRLQRQRG